VGAAPPRRRRHPACAPGAYTRRVHPARTPGVWTRRGPPARGPTGGPARGRSGDGLARRPATNSVLAVTLPTPGLRVGGLTAIAGALLSGQLYAGSPNAPLTPPSQPSAPRAAATALAGPDPAAPAADPAALGQRLAGPLHDPALGSPAGLVLDALTGKVLFDARSTVPTPPASTVKMAVAAAALSTFGPEQTLQTRVVYSSIAPGGTLWLVGGGDPTLSPAPTPGAYPALATLTDLAAQVRRAGITAVSAVVGDASAFSGPALAPGWRDGYVTEGNVTPVSALEVDGGRVNPAVSDVRVSDPAGQAAGEFATALRAAGVRVGATGTGPAPSAARQVATVSSPPIPVLVQRMLTMSDNDIAECLGRLVARRHGQPATFDGAARATLGVLGTLGIPTAGTILRDVSGLSIDDRIAPATLLRILRTAVLPGQPQLRAITSGLPVAGFSGTLATRYLGPDAASAAGDVRAKTGTLRTVTSLAGQLVTADGRLLLFGFFAPVQDTGPTRAALDRVAAALAGCGCRPSAAGTG
jgi:serine-type D-Ala-D-Ala carboxypeptidase/endopeptidase (penicillin-binding protein 4)